MSRLVLALSAALAASAAASPPHGAGALLADVAVDGEAGGGEAGAACGAAEGSSAVALLQASAAAHLAPRRALASASAVAEAPASTSAVAEAPEAAADAAGARAASLAARMARRKVREPPADSAPTAPIQGELTLNHFSPANGPAGCYDRAARSQWPVVDAHFHARPFGGPPIPFDDLMGWLQRAGILFATLYGIGQRLPIDSPCTYYLDCPGTPVKSSIKNDFDNAQSALDHSEALSTKFGPRITLSMSFVNLSHPETVVPEMRLLRKEYPGLFHWMGELNVVKQALWNNSAGYPIPTEQVADWAPFMRELRKQGMPVGFHSDLGNDAEPFKYLPVMDEILMLYPDNKIIWLHLGGLSKQLTPMAPALVQEPLYAQRHIDMLRQRLLQHPNLMLDLAWDVLYTGVWQDPTKRQLYVDFIEEFPTRFLPGTDFVAADYKNESVYRGELNRTAFVYQFLSDVAFRRIALGENYFRLLGLDYTAPPVC